MKNQLHLPPGPPAGWLFFYFAAIPLVSAAEPSTNLPPPATSITINFDRDIQPIFAQSCLRCHGPEKPRSHFRLDNRVSALQGGNENTNDVVPGNSVNSLLLSYVARQVPDMEMPPPGRGDPLTPRQISLLRAWIDQGANWSTNLPGPQTEVTLATFAGGVAVHGNQNKYRELANTPGGALGGVESFSLLEQINPNEKLAVDGRVSAPNQDYLVNLSLDKTDVGFVHAGFEQWRKYYDNRGGYNALAVPPDYQLNQELFVDYGRLWADFGLTRPNQPQIVLGYEYQYQHGNQSTLDWGNAYGLNLYPSFQAINADTQIIKLDAAQDFQDWHLSDSARVEIYTDNKTGTETSLSTGSPPTVVNPQDSYHNVQGMNTLAIDKQIRDWWHVSGGLYYSKLAGSDTFSVNPIPGVSLSSLPINLDRESEIFSVSSLFTPLKCLNFSVGSQNEWTRTTGSGGGVPNLDLFTNTPANSSLNIFQASQNAGLHYTQIPWTVLFADARVDEEEVGENQSGDPTQFERKTDAFNLRQDIRAGFTTSPWRWFSWTTQYHEQGSDTDYNNVVDVYNALPAAATNGYPAFILNRNITSQGLETKLVLRPASWVSSTFSCDLTETEYHSTTDPAFDLQNMVVVSPGGAILDGQASEQTYGCSTTLAPVRQLWFTTAFTFSQNNLSTAANGDPAVAPWHGRLYTVSTTATWAVNAKTSLQAGYNFSHSDYFQNSQAPALPFGLDFTRHQLLLGLTRQLTRRLSGGLHYEFAQYSEPGVGSANNFTAQGVFASLVYKWQ